MAKKVQSFQDKMFTVQAEISPRDLMLSGMEQDEIFEMICGLDDAVADYDFTVKLRDHFAEVIRAEDKAIGKHESAKKA